MSAQASNARGSTVAGLGLVAVMSTEDRATPPSAQRRIATRASAEVIDVRASQATYISHLEAVDVSIERATTSIGPATKTP